MKERFSKIFELWNQRNIGFYKECFNKLETENKTSFNYIAGIFPVMWLVFRKMYGWAMLFVLIQTGISAILLALFPSATRIPSILFSLILFVVFGFFGNTLYYKHVKSKVAKGYSELEDYNSIDPIWCALFVIGSGLLGVFVSILLTMKGATAWVISFSEGFTSVLIIAIPWAIECKKFCSQKGIESVAVTQDSLCKYLEKANSKNMFAAVWVWLLGVFLTIVSIVGMKYLGQRILMQMNKISEEMDGALLNSEKLNAKSNEVTEELNKISEEIEKTQDNLESADVSGVVSEIQNDNIDDQLANLSDEIGRTLNDSKNSEVTEEIAEAEESDETQNASENFDTSIQNDQDSDQSLDEDIDQD